MPSLYFIPCYWNPSPHHSLSILISIFYDAQFFFNFQNKFCAFYIEIFKKMFHHSSSHLFFKSLYSTLKNHMWDYAGEIFEGEDEKIFSPV